MKPTLALVLIAALAALPACGSGDDAGDSRSGSGEGDALVTGSAKCNEASMQEAVRSWAKANGGGKATLPGGSDGYRCADGWAVAFPNVGSGEAEVTVTAVFEAEGQFWIPKDRGQVCGKNAKQSDVPASLYKDACQTN